MSANRWSGARVDAVLFDLDGTLLDSAPDLGAAAEAMRQARGLAPLELSSYRRFAGSGARGMLKVAFGVTSEHEDYLALRDEFFVRYEDCMTERTRPFPSVSELLEAIAQRGFRWGIVTNKSARFAEPLTRLTACLRDAEVLVCGDTTAHTKPHPAPLLEAARRLAVKPAHCLYVGDDERDVIAGRAAGMRTVAARYGYLGTQDDTAEWNADAAIDSPLALLKLLPAA